jgi:hypothetical protein
MATGIFTLRNQLQGLIQKAWTGTQKTNFVEYLVVGGGGGAYVGGGGAGGLIQGVTSITTGTPITVTIGGGGAFSGTPTSGQNSVFGNITAVGGAASANASTAPSGGSGGGGSYTAVKTGGQGTFGQGNAGGTNTSGTTNAAGGGGAGTVGLNSTSSSCGNGGAGIASAINGTVTAYAGGGGGSGTGTAGVGGVGGGGTGNSSATTGNNGTPNTGGGGGGSYNASGYGNGGSGIVIISYPDIYAAPTFGGANSPTASTSGSGSLSFGGSVNSYISTPTSSNFNLGTGNFTIEFWIYFNATATQGIFGQINSSLSASSESLAFSTNSSGQIIAECASGATQYDITSSALSTSTWYHIAYVRNSTTITLYVNGTSAGTVSVSTNSINSGSTPFTIGRYGDYTSSYFLNGYISNFRLVKGTAVYTANFTAPTAPLTPITNTVLLLGTVSPSQYLDQSTVGNVFTLGSSTPTWNQSSPFATGLGYKNRVYTWTASGTVTF